MPQTQLELHLEKLRCFVAVAESKSIAKAALRMRLTQPALSHTIKVLESALETRLFVRTSRGIVPTREGTRLLEFSKTLLAEVEDFQNQWRMREELKHPKFKIGTKETFAIYLWPHYLRGLKKLYPHYEFELTIKRTNVDLLELLNDNKLDMLMIPDPPEREDLRSFEVFKETYGIFGAKSFKSPLERAEIFTFKNAMAAENRTIQGILAREGISVGMVVDVDSFGVAKAMMLQGLGLALLPKSVVQHELSSGAVKPVIADFSPSAMGVLKICLTIHERNAGRSELKTLLSEIRRMQKKQFEIKTAKYAN